MSPLKIFAVNSSPKKEKGNTVKLLSAFLEGAREAGATTHLEQIFDQGIEPCSACYSCWFKTPGECVKNDDMIRLLDKLKESDVLVFCTPLYGWGVSGVMKNFIDRMLPIGSQFVELRGDYVTKRFQSKDMPEKIVVVSSCGLPGVNHFDALVSHFENLSKYSGLELSGMLLRPNFRESLFDYSEIYSTAKKAGMQLVNEGRVSEDLQNIIAAPFISNEEYVKTWNKQFE